MVDSSSDSFNADAMTYSRWRQIKSCLKLNNFVAAPCGESGYYPAAKYDMTFKVTDCM